MFMLEYNSCFFWVFLPIVESIIEMVIEWWKEMFYLMMQSTHFIYSYMSSDIW